MNEKYTSDKEEKILEAAIKVISEKGFKGATTQEIAKEAGVAEGTIFRYFKTKKDILYKILSRTVEIMAPGIVVDTLKEVLEENKDKTDEEILKAVLKNRLCLFNKYFPLFKIILYESLFHEDLRNTLVEKVFIKALNVMVEYINKGIEEGRFRNVDPLIAVRSLVGMIMISVIQKQFFPDKLKGKSIEDEIDEILDLYLNGLRS